MIQIANREIGLDRPVFCVAEISGNHNGDLDRALRLIQAAKDAGADAVKFQAFTLEEILALRGTGQAPPPWEAMSLPELYAKLITPAEWFPALFTYARQIGIIPFSSVFGRDSLAMLEKLDCPAYKIAKPECRNWDLRKLVAATRKPFFVSGDSIHCPGGYPARLEDMAWLDWPVAAIGLSSHCPDPVVGPVAVAYGAEYLEFHMMLDDGVPTLDDPVNLTASQFAEMVRLARKAETMR